LATFLIYTVAKIVIGINYSRKIMQIYNKRNDIFGWCALYPEGLFNEILKKIPILYEQHRDRYFKKYQAEKSGFKITEN
jgi:hypothetical protein